MKYFGIPIDAKFCVFVVKPQPDTIETDKIELKNVLSPLLPGAIFIPHPDGVAIVCIFKEEDEFEDIEQLKVWIHSVREPIGDRSLLLGVSDIERSMTKLSSACSCALRSIEVGSRIQNNRKQWSVEKMRKDSLSDSNIFVSTEYEIYMLLEDAYSNGANLITHNHCCRGLYELNLNDTAKNMNNLDLLRTYIYFDCSASKTANALFMHRNNVTYRISRIQDRLGIDVDDSHIRFLLMLGYYMIDLYGIDCLSASADLI